MKKDYKVYRGFPKTERHCLETYPQFIVGMLADLVNAFVFHVYRRSFRRKVAEGKTKQIEDLRDDLCRALKLDQKVLSHCIWTSYDLLKPGSKHFETALALWRSVLDDPSDREAYRVELLGKRIAIFGEYMFGIPGVQTLRDHPVRAAQVLQAHVKKINPVSYTFLDVLEKKDQKIKDLELQMERYKCIAADLYFRHILEQLPGPIPLDNNRKRMTSATKHWDAFLRNAMSEAGDVHHPLHQLLSLVNDKNQAVKLLGEALYQSLSINIHHEFIALNGNASDDSYRQIIPEFKYSRLERALFKALIPLSGQDGTQLDWDREKDKYITKTGARGQGSSGRGWGVQRFDNFQGGIHQPRGRSGWSAD